MIFSKEAVYESLMIITYTYIVLFPDQLAVLVLLERLTVDLSR